MADFTVTEADQFLLDIWADSIEEFRRRSLIGIQTVTMASEFGVGRVRGFQNLNIPTTTLLNSGTARQKSASTNITYDSNTDTALAMAVDQHWYNAFNVEDFADAISGFDIEAAYAPTVFENLVRKEDATIMALIDNFTTHTYGAFADDITEEVALRAIQDLDDGDVPDESRVWVMSNPAQLGLSKQSKWSSKDYNAGRVTNGIVGGLYNYPVLKSTAVEGSNAAGHDNGLVHRSYAIHHRVGNRPRVRRFSDIDSQSERMSASMIWGNGQFRTDAAVWIKGL